MKISVLAAQQIPEAVALWDATELTRPWNDPCADTLRALETSTSTVLAASEGSQVIATAMVGHDGHRGWLYYVAVDPRRQGSGLGAQMVQAASDWLTQCGVPKVQLMVREENAAVRGFYERLGFEDQHVLVLGKRLDASA
ncbi:acetyltransferase [Glutamicibacter halophytocola]|uniref:GNAT family acetyltransferase n=1 Tax=Glutamicibacter halophytocola TaxID=1933880 RepID=UPI0006D4BE7F|nr:GNAT family acetyltransferase [Glutamicibacter halophytocola]ALG28399.1 acetyltransferase [Glutamicibacter halophytocola]